MVFFVILLLACTARIAWRTDRQTDRQNDKPSTVTLAAHARRGLIIEARIIKKKKKKIKQNRPLRGQEWVRGGGEWGEWNRVKIKLNIVQNNVKIHTLIL